MKEIIIERKVYDKEYEAIDGSVFPTKELCQKYEDSFKCVLNERFNKIVAVNKIDAHVGSVVNDMWYNGNEVYYKFIPKSEDEIIMICMYARAEYSYGAGDDFVKDMEVGKLYIICESEASIWAKEWSLAKKKHEENLAKLTNIMESNDA